MSKIVNFQDYTPQKLDEVFSNENFIKLFSDASKYERFKQSAILMMKDTAISQCTQDSVIGGLYRSVILGLRPELNECYLLPFRDSKTGNQIATFQIGYKGYEAIAKNSGSCRYIQCSTVFEKDKISITKGLNPTLFHEPSLAIRGKIIGFYAVAKTREGDSIFEFITIADAEKCRKNSKNQYQNGRYSEEPVGFWKNGYDKMALRLPIKRLCQALPMNERFENAFISDNSITTISEKGIVEVKSEAQIAETIYEETIANPIETETQNEYIEQVQNDLKHCFNREEITVCRDNFVHKFGKDWVGNNLNLFSNRVKELENGK